MTYIAILTFVEQNRIDSEFATFPTTAHNSLGNSSPALPHREVAAFGLGHQAVVVTGALVPVATTWTTSSATGCYS